MRENVEMLQDEIESIEYYGEEDTIDITVSDTHMFFANDLYTHNSGFGSEFVEAYQTGGSIKRVQKAHFFMSIAKTPEQQEANFANIRIIKARFARDGQSFEDCVFNNDTMIIDIDDPRYRSSKSYRGLKHYDDASELEKKMEKICEKSSDVRTHVAINKKEEELIDKVNSDKINSMLIDNAIPEDKNDVVSDAVNDVVSDAVKKPELDLKQFKSPGIPIIKLSSHVITENIDELEKELQDPDDIENGENTINNMLVKKRDYQHVIPKKKK